MARDFKASDEGKHVVTADGEAVGTIAETSGSSASVAPEEDLSQSIRRRLGWTEEGEAHYELEQSMVDRFTEDEVRLKRSS